MKELYNPLLSECIFKRLLDNRKEKGTRAQMCPAIASGIITGDRLFSRLAYKLSSNFFTSASGRFFCFLRQKRARERELLVLGPTTGTGSEKRRTLRKSVPSNSPRFPEGVSQNFLPVSKVMNGG